jgi:octaprenyl-diphosphate synthase
MPLEPIRSLVQADLEATNQFICTELKSGIPFINELMDYILSCGGKRIRPMIVLLAARAFSHDKTDHISLAAAIELIHTATLLHDDVVDHATLRRGHKTANNIWGNQAAVLVGDFLYSRAFQLIVKLNHAEILDTFAQATHLIAEGEVMQLLNCHNPDASETAYFEVIQRKTAKLFEVAARIGTALAKDYTSDHLSAMGTYGTHLGIAYQLIDDALDYDASSAATGKNIGNDLAEGKPTLPLIYALQQSSPSEAEFLKNAIKNGSCDRLDDIISIIHSTGAIKYTANAAKLHAQKANQALTFIPDSPYRKGLQDLSSFVVERNH